jgi:hypothetical protein
MTTVDFTAEEWSVIDRYLGLSASASANVECDCGAVISMTAMPKHKLSKLHSNRLTWGEKYKERLDTSYTCECGGRATYRSMNRHNTSVMHQKFLSSR